MKTFMAKSETIEHQWCLIDAAGKTLGRLCTEVARRLRGKHKPEYTSHVDTGDYVIVVNAEKIVVTGNKTQEKIYEHYTGYPGGLKAITFDKLLAKFPSRIIEKAVKGMLPKNPLGYAMFRKLKVYAGPNHPHSAQQPQSIEISE